MNRTAIGKLETLVSTVTELINTQFPFYFRVVMMPGEEKEEVYVLQHITLKEGEMQGINLKDINKWVNRDG